MGKKQLFATALTANDSAATEDLGVEREEQTTSGVKTYKYVKFDNGTSNVTAAAGNLCYFYGTDGYTVTSELAYGNGRNAAAGVFVTALTDGYYGWIQTKGVCTVNTDGGDDLTKGMTAIAANANGTVDIMAIGTANTYKEVGVCLADDSDSANTVSMYLNLR